MNLSREEIIRMAREAGVVPSLVETTGTYFARVEKLARDAFAAGAAAEREACAQIGEAFDKERPQSNYGRCIAVAIRARGNGGEK